MLPHLHQPVHHGFKLPHGLNLLPIERHQGGIGQALGDGLRALLTRPERIRSTLDTRTVLAFNHEELLGERAASYFGQAGELLEKLLAMLLDTGVIGRSFSHIVVYILQYTEKNQAKKPRPTFISYTLAKLSAGRPTWQ